MLLSAVSVLVGAQSSSEIPEGLMNNPVDENECAALVELHWQQKTAAHEDSLFQCHFVRHKSDTGCPGIEPVPPQWHLSHGKSSEYGI